MISVLDEPVIKFVGPNTEISKEIGSKVELSCGAQGYPSPSYRWIQVTGNGEVVRAHHKTIHIPAIAYTDQGVYVCEASNMIKGEKRVARSEAIELEVHGAPVLKQSESKHFVATGSDARLEVELCADPQPEVRWVRSGLVEEELVEHLSHDIYAVEKLTMLGKHNDCYTTALTIKRPLKTEQHEYVLRVKNAHGESSHRARLTVGEVRSQEVLIGGLIGGCVTVVLILVVLGLWCRRCCCQPDKKIKQDMERYVNFNSFFCRFFNFDFNWLNWLWYLAGRS